MQYSEFNKTDNHSYNVYNALKYCKEHNENSLVFDKGTYHFCDEMAAEDMMCVSNHDMYCVKRIAFLLKDMKDFTLDGGESEFVFHDSIVPFSVINSENITLKNFSVDFDETMILDACVCDVNDSYIDVLVVNDDSFYISDSILYCKDSAGHIGRADFFCLRSKGEDKSFISQSCDEFDLAETRFEDLGNKKIRIHNFGLDVEKDMHLIIKNALRHSCDIVCSDSKDVEIKNITLYKSYAMGLLAQKTENITVDNMTVRAKDDCLYSLSADAVHFVHCKGLVKVINSSFSEQLDDALNIHGIYTKIIDKTDDYIIVKYMHHSAKGLNIYEKGSEIVVLTPETLISNGIYKISDVEVINMNYTKIYVEGGTKNIKVGDVIEDLTYSCDLLFENNRVYNNRARGMLIAAKGNVEIKNNYFNTPGVAILFESDGKFWYESGGTTGVIIKNNTFDNCKYTLNSWGESVIEIVPREKFNEGEYFHKYIEISDNSFSNCNSSLFYLDNVENIYVRNNNFRDCRIDKKARYINCDKINSDI